MLLDNCTAHYIDKHLYPYLLIILFLPPNVTNRHQPADMGMIAAIKVGYRVNLLGILLALFDVEGGYAAAAVARALVPTGCRGLDYGGKATILDAMKILNSMWERDNKYAKKDSIGRCWRKANILPPSWDADINNNLGSASISTSDKQITNEECNNLCHLFEAIRVKVEIAMEQGEANNLVAFDDSFACEQQLSAQDCATMACNWVMVEDNQNVIDKEVDNELLLMEVMIEKEVMIENNIDDDVDDNEMLLEETEDNIVTFLEAQEHLRQVQLYINMSGVGNDCINQCLVLSNCLRAHHAAKPRNNPTLFHFFAKK